MVSFFYAGFFNEHSHFIGVSRYIKIQIIFKQCNKLYSKQPAFSKHTALLLYDVTKIRLKPVAANHQRLAKQSAGFSGSNVKCIA